MSEEQHVVGCFAPPLSDEALASYRTMCEGLSAGPVKDAMGVLLACVAKWWDLEWSTGPSVDRATNVGVMPVQSLDADAQAALYDAIPWPHELRAMGELFGQIDDFLHRELRDACHHLLWHVHELNLDREPLTHDKLRK